MSCMRHNVKLFHLIGTMDDQHKHVQTCHVVRSVKEQTESLGKLPSFEKESKLLTERKRRKWKEIHQLAVLQRWIGHRKEFKG